MNKPILRIEMVASCWSFPSIFLTPMSEGNKQNCWISWSQDYQIQKAEKEKRYQLLIGKQVDAKHDAR